MSPTRRDTAPTDQVLHVCMVVHAHYPVGEPRVQREARAAVDAGHAVTIIALRDPCEARSERIDGAEVRRLSVTHKRGVGLFVMIREYLSFAVLAAVELLRVHRARRIDVVQVHTPPDFLVFAALPLRLLGARIVLDIHDFSSHILSARFGGTSAAVGGRLLVVVEQAACRVASRIVTVNDAYRNELAAHGVAPGRVTVVMNAADEALVAQATANRPAQRTSFEIAYHGTVTNWFGLDLMVEALASLRAKHDDVTAVVLGEGDALPGVQALAAELDLVDCIEFSGRYLPIEEALAKVAGASCGVVPNRASSLTRSALSTKLLEYVALGIPVVVSQLETVEAHFTESEVTYFEPGNVDALVEALDWVYEHPDEALAKAEKAQHRARQYSWSVNRARYLQVLREV